MPLYDFACESCNRVTESRQGINTTEIPCRCGNAAARVQVYRDQHIQAETGPIGGKKTAPPPDQIDLRQSVSEFQEASAEVEHAYQKTEAETGKKIAMPNLYKEGLRRARKQGAAIQGSV